MDTTSTLCTNEKTLFERLVRSNVRSDGRQLQECRKVEVKFERTTKSLQQCSAQCLVSFGESQALAVVSCEIVEPYPDRATEGILTVSTTLSPMASEHFEYGKQSNSPEAIKVGSAIEQAVREAKALDTETLCIVAGSKVWSIRCDIHIINHCGNMIDTGCLAALGALVHFRRPEVSVVGNEVTVHELDDREPVPLSIHHLPLCVTFGLFRLDADASRAERVFLISDTTDKEEALINGAVTVIVNTHGEVCGVNKRGWPPIAV